MTNLVQFPGLGLEFTINRVAFSIGSFPVYWYGVILATGLLCGLLYIFHFSADFGIDQDRFVDVACVGTVMAIVCARIYYVAFFPGHYGSLWDMIDIRDGGIAMYGSLIGVFVFGGLACKWRKIPLLATYDAVAVGLLIGQGIGRWGNFVNQEAFGTNTTLPWGMYSQTTAAYLQANQALLAAEGVTVDPTMPVHPTFLYESLWCILGAIVFTMYLRHRKYNGEMAVLYCIWNGAGRFVIEGLRTDSLMLSVELNLRTSQVLALIMVVGGLAAQLFFLHRAKQQDPLRVELARVLAPKELKDFELDCGGTSLPATASHAEFVKATQSLNEKLKAAYASALHDREKKESDVGTPDAQQAPVQIENVQGESTDESTEN